MKDSRDNSADAALQHHSLLTPQEQSDRLAELMLASARRLATDPQRLAKIK
jgi:hypothetical protein